MLQLQKVNEELQQCLKRSKIDNNKSKQSTKLKKNLIMKNLVYTALICLLFNQIIFAQNKIEQSGQVGIGTTTPIARLHIKNDASGSQINELLRLGNGYNVNGNNNPSILFTNDNSSVDPLSTVSSVSWALSAYVAGIHDFRIIHKDGDKLITPFYINGSNGNVGIGTITPRETLSVNGNLRAKQIKVETANFPDYVFNEDYALMPLAEVAAFIQTNHRLPEIPSEKEVVKSGLDLGEINKLLVKKIEELTLYVIKLNAEVSEMSLKQKEHHFMPEEKVKQLSTTIKPLN
jgi:hypothetical protein